MRGHKKSEEKSSAVTSSLVVLTGFMGSGKTTVGRALAELLGWDFIDLDEVIERRERDTIRKIFANRGEPEFRQVEHAALRELVAQCTTPTVIALGGGTFVHERNRAILAESQARTVFLQVAVEEMIRRCDEDDSDEENLRPLAKDAESFRRLHDERLPFYHRATLTIDAHGKTAEEIAREIAEALQLASIL